MHSFSYRDDVLHCEDVSLEDLANRIGTPAYVYSAGDHPRQFSPAPRALRPLDRRDLLRGEGMSNLAVLQLG